MSRSIREVVKEFGPIVHVSKDERFLFVLGNKCFHVFEKAAPNDDFDRFTNEVRWTWLRCLELETLDQRASWITRHAARRLQKRFRRVMKGERPSHRVKEPEQ